jgi:limonene-1,2-epoxide hydrolase
VEGNEKVAKKLSRRQLAYMAPAGLLVSAIPAQSAELSDQEKANVELVNGFCAAWASRDIDRPLRFLSEDAAYRMSETTPPVKGHAGVIERLKTYVDESERVEYRVLATFASGPIVMNHRIDIYASKARPLTWEGVGVFFIQGGKIKEWSDYTIRIQRSV